jgi:hypothetical protein
MQLPTQDDASFPKLSARALRAPARAGYTRLEQLAQVPESSIERLHGMGPTGITALRDPLDERGLAFRN